MLTVSRRAFRLLPTSLPKEIGEYREHKNSQLAIIEELENALKISRGGGSEKAKALHKKRNKMLVMERVNAIMDEGGEFFDIGTLAGWEMDYGTIPSATMLLGIGKVHGIPCVFGASDGTVKGGTSYPITVKKALRGQQIGMQNFLPQISLVDSGGAFLPLQSEIFPDKNHGGRNFYNIASASQLGIPQVSVVCGSCTAGGAYTPTMCDEMVFVDKMGTMFLGGPPLVEAATGEKVTAEELGGATLHTSVSGCADYFAADEVESSEYVRCIVETLNIPETPTTRIASHPPCAEFDILNIASQKCDVRYVLSCLLDNSKFHEFKERFGAGLVTGYGRVGGQMVGFVCNNGILDANSARKGAHFVHLATERGLPLVFLQNSLYEDDFGDMTEANIQNSSETMRARAALTSSVAVSKTPKVTICCAGPNRLSDLCPIQYDPNFIFRWPGSRGLQTGVADEDSAINSSANVWDDGTIDPRDTRKRILQCLDIFQFTEHHKKHIQSKEGITEYQPVYRL